MSIKTFDIEGIGMTSQRTRDRLAARLKERGIRNPDVLGAIRSTPRHIFIEEAMAHRAYEDTALPIGQGQTISQPFIVALMTELLLDKPRQRVLEVGTGSGYQTAVLASLVPKVYSVERLQVLLDRARPRLQALKATNVRLRCGDGYEGWPGEAPFDGILVTAAPDSVPEALFDQLAIGGRLVVPVGDTGVQELQVFDKTADGIRKQTVDYVRFVPLVKGVKRT